MKELINSILTEGEVYYLTDLGQREEFLIFLVEAESEYNFPGLWLLVIPS